MQVIAGQGDTIDAICWRMLGGTAAVTEAALELNPGLADAGPIIAEGTLVNLPDAPLPQTTSMQLVQLWD